MEIQLLDGLLEGTVIETDATHLRGIRLRSGSDIFAVLNDATQARTLAVELAQQRLFVLKTHVEKTEEPVDMAIWIHRTLKDTKTGWHNPYEGKVERPTGAGMHIAELGSVIAAAEKIWISSGIEEEMKSLRQRLKEYPPDHDKPEIALTHRMLVGAYRFLEHKGITRGQFTDAIISDLPRLQTDKREPGDMTVLTEDVVHRLIASAEFKGKGFADFHTDVFGLHALYRPHSSSVPLITSFPGVEEEADTY